MKLSKRQMITISFSLFSLFFGAGNLIFPPFLGQNAGSAMPFALAGFLVTAVVLPILGVYVIVKFDGLDQLSAKVGKRFALVFSIAIYLSLGPGLAIPRAASVPFEMAVAPYLPENTNLKLCMFLYSLVFFFAAAALAMNSQELVNRIGHYMTPSLLVLLGILILAFFWKGEKAVASPVQTYADGTVFKGFLEGYQTMDALAGLNFGLVVATAFTGMGLVEKKSMLQHTRKAGIASGGLLALVYLSLAYVGMQSSGVYESPANGAVILRKVVYQMFGEGGAILLAAIFTLACLTVCVGLINSVSLFFAKLFPRIGYKLWASGILVISFLICNLGLTAILHISIPILNAMYPVSIVLIMLALLECFFYGERFVYRVTVSVVLVLSVIEVAGHLGISLGVVHRLYEYLPLSRWGLGWSIPAVLCMVVCTFISLLKNHEKSS